MSTYELSLANRDLYLVQIEQQLNDKQQFLIDKYNESKELEKDNEYLRVIRDDYKQYHDYVVSQKNEQVTAMHFLNDYLDKMTETSGITDEDLERMRTDQRNIVDEIRHIKEGLDKLTNNLPRR